MTLRVQTGCDEQCSYCIIPHDARRGPVEAARRTCCATSNARVDAGYREIAITGVHLGSYGRDLRRRLVADALVRALGEWPDDVLFRISSLEPMDCTPEIVDLVAASPRLAPHFHLPLQHGSDAMLRAMRRPYTARPYQRSGRRIRDADAARVDRLRHHRRLSRRDGRALRGDASTLLERSAADAPARLSVLGSAGHRGQPRCPAKVDGAAIRDARPARSGAIGDRDGATVPARRRSGTTRRALTVDDGWSAVTDNYLKVRLDAAAAAE